MKYDFTFLELELRELLKKLKKHNTYAMQLEDEIRLYALENARLKESEEYHRKGYAELHQRINKAIEYIETNIEDEYNYHGLLYENEEKKKLLDILRGEDNE